MEIADILKEVIHVRNDDEEIVAIQLPIAAWKALIDRIQELEDRDAAREHLARLRKTQSTRRLEE